MSSLRKLLSSQANGRLAKGPVTELGKSRSSQNALFHGLLAQRLVLDGESSEGLQSLLDQHLERIRPSDGLEENLIGDMVSNMWRLQRSRAVEGRLINDAISQSPDTDDPLGSITNAITALNQSGALPLIHRYEARLHKMYQRTLQNLILLRTLLPNEPNPISEHSGTTLTALPDPN